MCGLTIPFGAKCVSVFSERIFSLPKSISGRSFMPPRYLEAANHDLTWVNRIEFVAAVPPPHVGTCDAEVAAIPFLEMS